MTIDFYGLFHFDDFKVKLGTLMSFPSGIPAPNTFGGVYIWGFVYECINGKPYKPIDMSIDSNRVIWESNKNKLPRNWKFIPYYVGQTDEKDSGIFGRLKEHHNLNNNNVKHYIRLSHDYMKEFYIDPEFPIKTSKPNNDAVYSKYLNDNNAIEYFNEARFLQAKYPGIIISETTRLLKTPKKIYTYYYYPISEQKLSTGNNLPDTLDDIINKSNNFFFCFAPVIPPLNLKGLETFAFWSLKGITTSETGSCPNASITLSINDINGIGIFKLNPSMYFPGY